MLKAGKEDSRSKMRVGHDRSAFRLIPDSDCGFPIAGKADN
jgi:hypothetical protein